MGKSSNATQSSGAASSVTPNSKVPVKQPTSKVAVKQLTTVKVHVTPSKNETGVLFASVLNSYCCRQFLNSLKDKHGSFNRLITYKDLTKELEWCKGQNEVQITNKAEQLQVSENEITDVLGYFFNNNLGSFSYCNVVKFFDNDAAKNFFEELDKFHETTFDDKTIQIVFHPPKFTTHANDFYVHAVLDHLCNEDNNGQMQNRYHDYF